MSTLTDCVKITRTDGAVIGMTSLDKDLAIAGVTYKSVSGYTPSGIDQNRDVSVSNLEFQGLLDSASIVTPSDLIGGKYDNAKVHIFNYDYITNVVVETDVFNGYMGDVTVRNGSFNAEVRSLHQILKNDLTEKYSPTCRVELGDSKCTKDITAFTFTGSVTSTTNRSTFSDSTKAQAVGYFKYGVVTWTSGANSGLKSSVAEFSATSFRLFFSLPKNIVVGDTFSVVSGCDKLLSTCKDKFNNLINFRGEPSLPGRDKVLLYPNAR